MFGTFSPAHQRAVRPYVRGKRVLDLGAGDGTRASILRHDCGAAAVLAIDRNCVAPTRGVEVFQAGFSSCVEKVTWWRPDVAHVAWPWNLHSLYLINLLMLVPVVIYVGCNTGGTACGTPGLFDHFLTRSILAHVPERRNTLLVYGEPGEPAGGPRCCEERGGLDALVSVQYDTNEESQ